MEQRFRETAVLLDALGIEIGRGNFRRQKGNRRVVSWSGPGVHFATRLIMGSPSGSGPQCGSTAVITPHAHAARWILDRIDEAFEPLLGEQMRWDFFERIAGGVQDYLAFIPPDQDSDVNLLKVILRESRDILTDMEFPSLYHGEDR